jgi:hypothetical protein
VATIVSAVSAVGGAPTACGLAAVPPGIASNPTASEATRISRIMASPCLEDSGR